MSEKLFDEELNEVTGGAGEKAPYKLYFVQPGESLSIIAQKFNTTIDELCRLNSITKDTMLHPNDRLIVPNK